MLEDNSFRFHVSPLLWFSVARPEGRRIQRELSSAQFEFRLTGSRFLKSPQHVNKNFKKFYLGLVKIISPRPSNSHFACYLPSILRFQELDNTMKVNAIAMLEQALRLTKIQLPLRLGRTGIPIPGFHPRAFVFEDVRADSLGISSKLIGMVFVL